MDIVLVAGLWLTAAVWDAVVPVLEAAGHSPIPVMLPGQDDGLATATLADQVSAVTGAIDRCSGPVLVVGHSAACSLAWIAADARPEKVAKMVMVGGFPSGDGETYADFFPCSNGVMPFPGWQHFEGPDSRDLDEPTKDRMAGSFVSVPEGVAKGIIHLSDQSRYEIPVVIVCPEFSVEQAREWLAEGVPELKPVNEISYVNIDSGHWPMLTRPTELGQILSALTGV